MYGMRTVKALCFWQNSTFKLVSLAEQTGMSRTLLETDLLATRPKFYFKSYPPSWVDPENYADGEGGSGYVFFFFCHQCISQRSNCFSSGVRTSMSIETYSHF